MEAAGRNQNRTGQLDKSTVLLEPATEGHVLEEWETLKASAVEEGRAAAEDRLIPGGDATTPTERVGGEIDDPKTPPPVIQATPEPATHDLRIR